MSPTSNTLTNHARSYGLVDNELLAFQAGTSHYQTHPQDPRAYRLEARIEAETPRKVAAAEVLLDDWTDPNNPAPIGITCAVEQEDVWIGGPDARSIALGFVSLLERLGREIRHIVIWEGKGVVFHAFLRHLAKPLTYLGVKVQPLVSGVDIKAIILKRGGSSWTLCDIGAMTGTLRTEAGAICAMFGACSQSGLTRSRQLLSAATRLQEVLRSLFGVAIRPTIAAVALQAARMHLDPAKPWYRPRLALESVCRFGGAYRGGYVYSEGFQGGAWRIDVNRLYTSLLRRKLPASASLGHAGEKGKEKAGIYLCRVEGKGYFPSYLSAFTLTGKRFHKERSTTPGAWCWLPSAEFAGLRALGYEVTAGLGFTFDGWIDLKPFAERLLSIVKRHERTSPEAKLAKSVGNALTGKLGQSPERLDVCYSVVQPGEGWTPYITAEAEEIEGLWVNRHLVFDGGQHVDAAAWLTSQGRSMVMSQLARVQALGWRAVHVDTDGIILDQDPRGVLPLSDREPGMWRYEGYDPECVVSRNKWYSFQGEVHTAGLSGVTREQLEAVHYGKRVVIGRKVLANPLASETAYREQFYHLGG